MSENERPMTLDEWCAELPLLASGKPRAGSAAKQGGSPVAMVVALDVAQVASSNLYLGAEP